MDKDKKIQKIIQCKNEVDKLIHEKYHELAQNYDLTIEQFHLLIDVEELRLDINDEFSAPTEAQMAKSAKNSQNTVSERITRLENKGLVRRIKDNMDKRISRVVLTDGGRALIESIDKQASSKFLYNSIANMEDSEINKFLSSLEKLIKLMNVKM